MAPATPTCQLSLKQELKGAQRVWNSYHLQGGLGVVGGGLETETVAMRRAERGPEGQAGRQQHLTER